MCFIGDVLKAATLHHVIFDILHKYTPMSLHQSVYLIQVALLALEGSPVVSADLTYVLVV